MKRLLFLFIFSLCLATGYGQVGRTKQTTRLPWDSVAMQSTVKGRNAQLIDGSQNVQARSGGQSLNPYAMNGGQQRLLPGRINKSTVAGVTHRMEEPKPFFIERVREQSQLRSSIVGGHRETTYAFFKETPQLKIPHPELQIRIDTIETDKLNMTHVKGAQLFRNIPIYGMNFTFHISEGSERFLGYTVDTTSINTNETLYAADDAIRIARSDLSLTTAIKAPGELMKKTLKYEAPKVEAIYYPTPSNAYNYTYKVVIRPNFRDEWIYYVDAISGEIVEKYNNTPTDGPNTGTGNDLNGVSRTVNTYLENGTHYMLNTTKPMFKAADFSGIIGVYDAKNEINFHDEGVAYLVTNSSATWNNPNAISAMYHTSLVYDYLQKTFNRNSYDGKGSSMQAIINVCDPDDGLGYDNAYWNGAIIALGNGSIVCYPLAGGLDVIAHEFGHAVVSSTANLEYKNQSGAINEAYADIFGTMVDRSNWTIGETIIKNRYYFPTGNMRDMRNPHNGGTSIDDPCWQPASVAEMYLGTEDNGGVHINNSVPAHTFYLYASATSKERAEQVYYRALTTYLTPTSKFIDLRKAIIQSVKDLGYSGDVQTIEEAFNSVGIVDDTVVPPPPSDLPSNPGQWGLLLCNTDPSDHNSLYKTTNYTNLTPISTTVMYSTPSVTDDGKYTIFVDNKNNIRLLDMTTGKEDNLNAEGDNQSVAISRDGKRLAVITTYEDSRIWVYDFNSARWMAFKLYNPTTGTGGAKSGGPRYADAIEFDHTGEYLIYDAYNVVGSSIGGRAVDYWDIGLIHVWNNSRNTWGTGEVVKLFSDMTAGVNVMNPVFSKNSPYIIAFDYYDEEEDVNATLGLNLTLPVEDGLDVMFLNIMPSYPSYSMDDKQLAFTTFDYNAYDFEIGYFNLQNNKISVTGNEVIFVTGGGYPVYYGTGSRQLGAKPVASFTSDARTGGSPLNVQFMDMSNGNPTTWRWTFQGGTPSSSTQQHPKVTYNTTGTFSVTLVATNSYGSDEVVRQGYVTVGTTGSETVAQETVTVYPNPASRYVWINSPAMVQGVKLYDLTGKAIPVTCAEELGKIRLDISRLPRGIYILHIALPDGKMQTQKIIKN